MNIQESIDKMFNCVLSGSEFSNIEFDTGLLEISKESLDNYADFGFCVLTFMVYWNVADENHPEKFGLYEPNILLGAGEMCGYEDGTCQKSYKFLPSYIPDDCAEIHYAISELCKYLDSRGFKRDIDHLKDLPNKQRREYRAKVCSGKEFSNKNDSLSYAKIKYLFDHNASERIAEWLKEYHPGGGYYSNKELNEIRAILNKL